MANMMHNAHRAGTAMPDWLFVIWAGGTALVSYSLVYALRKPFTAAEFEGMQAFGMDYKIAVSIIQLIGYVCAKMLGIKFISELRPENRLRFIIGSAALSEASLLSFALMPVPANIFALFFNGLSLGCMWGVLFSFLEGRRTTDILASIIGAVAFPLLCLTGWMMTRLPKPDAADVAARSERVTLNGRQRWQLFRRFMPVLLLLFTANLLLTVQRDIKEDFIVCIIDVSTVPSWAFAYLDGIATVVLLAMFAILSAVGSHLRVLCTLLGVSTAGMALLAFIGAYQTQLALPTTLWLFLQTLCIDIAYLSFQTIFFERFIACFKLHANVGFFIITIDFIGYLGTLGILLFKELGAPNIDWPLFYNEMSTWVGVACCIMFVCSVAYLVQAGRTRREAEDGKMAGRQAISGFMPAN